MNNKKYQVFVSSTFIDLQEERRKVLDILLMADCIPAGMEAFVATDDEQFEVIKKVINLCDYYILIIGKRYGSVNEVTGKSYTEMEYEYAKEMDIPVLVFALDESVELPHEKTEDDDIKRNKLQNFKTLAMQNRLASIWKSVDDLTGKVAISIMKAKSEIERPGWQRGGDFDEGSLRREVMDSRSEVDKLKKRLAEAEEEIAMLSSDSDASFEDFDVELRYGYYCNDDVYINYATKVFRFAELFLVIAIEMEGISIPEAHIETALNKQLFSNGYIVDKQLVRRTLIQLKALKLVSSNIYVGEDYIERLHWKLTPKGTKTRNDMMFPNNENTCGEE